MDSLGILLILIVICGFFALTEMGLASIGESVMALSIEHGIEQWLPLFAGAREQLALVVTVAIVTAVSIVFGEIVPKRIALAYPEDVARLVAVDEVLATRRGT